MIQLRDGFGFADEALAEFGRVGLMRQQHFDGDEAIERGLLRLVDRGHAAMPDRFDDVILAQRCADEIHSGQASLVALRERVVRCDKHTIFREKSQ